MPLTARSILGQGILKGLLSQLPKAKEPESGKTKADVKEEMKPPKTVEPKEPKQSPKDAKQKKTKEAKQVRPKLNEYDWHCSICHMAS